MAAPFRVGEELELTVDSLAAGGRGVARHDGVVVFVDRALPGDRVMARVQRVKRRHGEAIAVERCRAGPTASRRPARTSARAAAAAGRTCATSGSSSTRQQQVLDALQRIGRLSGFELEPIGRPCRAVRLPQQARVRLDAQHEGPALGFHAAGRWEEIVPL